MNLLSIDTESCDGSAIDGSLCSVGYTLFDEKFNILSQKDILVNPLPQVFKLSSYGKAPRINLAYEERVFRASPRFKEVYGEIKKLFENVLVLGFSFTNDIAYLNDACDKFGLPRIDFKYIDVQTIYSIYKGEKRQVGLSRIAEEFGIEFTEHRSDEDARATGLILKKITEQLGVNTDELIIKYELILGENGLEPRYMSYGAKEREKFDKSVKSVKKILIEEFKSGLAAVEKKIPFKLSGKSFCFAEDIEYGDVDLFRSLIFALHERGVRVVKAVSECNVFVRIKDGYGDRYFNAKARISAGEKIRIINFDYLKSLLGEYALLDFSDDNKVLSSHYERAEIYKREKAKLKKSSAKKVINRVKNEKFSFSIGEAK